MGTRTGTIVLGTIVPIRHETCYSINMRRRTVGLDRDGDALPIRAGGADQNRAKVSLANIYGLQVVRIVRSVTRA